MPDAPPEPPLPPPPAAAPPPVAFYSAGSLRPETSVGLLMKRVMQSVLLQVDRKLAAHDLTHAQWLPLYRIARGEIATMAALAREQSMDPGAMTRALDRLEAKGLLRRERSQQDRRVVQLLLTDAGRAVSQQVPPVLAEVLNAHLAGFAEAEWLQLIDLLQRMLANGDALRDPRDTRDARDARGLGEPAAAGASAAGPGDSTDPADPADPAGPRRMTKGAAA